MAGPDAVRIATLIQRRQDWIHQIVALARRWHLSWEAIRTIHEYVIGFNWCAIYVALDTAI